NSVVNGANIYHAFIWSGGVMSDLNNLISPASGWELTQAQDLNDVGQIVGEGTIGGQTHAFLLTPTVPEPANMALFILAPTLLCMRRRRGIVRAALLADDSEKVTHVVCPLRLPLLRTGLHNEPGDEEPIRI